MKKLIVATVMSAMCLMPSIASAETYFQPAMDNSGVIGNPWTWHGPVTVQKGILLNCDVWVKFDGTESATDTHGSFSHTDVSDITGLVIEFRAPDALCPIVGPGTSSSGASYDPVTHDITFYGVQVPTITAGNCYGDLVANLDPNTNKLTVSGSLPPEAGGGTCYFDGELDLVVPEDGEINEDTTTSGHTHPHSHTHP